MHTLYLILDRSKVSESLRVETASLTITPSLQRILAFVLFCLAGEIAAMASILGLTYRGMGGEFIANLRNFLSAFMDMSAPSHSQYTPWRELPCLCPHKYPTFLLCVRAEPHLDSSLFPYLPSSIQVLVRHSHALLVEIKLNLRDIGYHLSVSSLSY
jgi:hypothetical protein